MEHLEENIRQVFLDCENKISYKDLVEKFKFQFVEDSAFKQQFKKIVGKLATIKEENGERVLVLKSKYQRKGSGPLAAKTSRADGLQASILQALTGSSMDDDLLSLNDFDKLDFFTVRQKSIDDRPVVVCEEDVENQPADFSTNNNNSDFNLSSDSEALKKLLKPLHVNAEENTIGEQQFHSDIESSSSPYVTANEENESNPPSSAISTDFRSTTAMPYLSQSESDLKSCIENERVTANIPTKKKNLFEATTKIYLLKEQIVKNQTIPSLPVVNVQKSESEPSISDVVTVKTRAKEFNSAITSNENDRKSVQSKAKLRQSHKDESASPESGSVASVSLSDKERVWLVTSAKCDYQTLAKSLTANPELVNVIDFTSGYTALHYAAKFGHSDAIKLLAGKHGADVDRKSGYTPLHLAAMHGQRTAIDLLIKTYGANDSIIDNSGRLAKHYVNNVYGTKRVKIADLAAHKSMSCGGAARSHSPTKGVRNSYSSQSLPGQLPSGYIRIGSIRKAGAAALNRIRGHGNSTDDYEQDFDRKRNH